MVPLPPRHHAPAQSIQAVRLLLRQAVSRLEGQSCSCHAAVLSGKAIWPDNRRERCCQRCLPRENSASRRRLPFCRINSKSISLMRPFSGRLDCFRLPWVSGTFRKRTHQHGQARSSPAPRSRQSRRASWHWPTPARGMPCRRQKSRSAAGGRSTAAAPPPVPAPTPNV